jgi:signal transduction histidine kinase
MMVLTTATQTATLSSDPHGSVKPAQPATEDEHLHPTALDRLAVSADHPSGLVQRIVQVLRPMFGAIRVGLLIWDGEHSALQMATGSFGAPDRLTAWCRVEMDDPEQARRIALVLQRTYLTNDARADPNIPSTHVRAFGLRCVLSVPLVVERRPTGVLLIARADKPFSQVDADRCTPLAPRISIALESTLIRMRLSHQSKIETVLSEQAVAIASGAECKDALRTRLDQLRKLLDATAIAFVASDCSPLIASDPHAGDDVARWIGERVRCEGEARAALDPAAPQWPLGMTVLQIPVRLGTQLIGTLVALRGRWLSFSVEDRRGLERMAELIALSWAWGRYQQHRAELARLEERQRIADDLHDDVVQILFAAQMQLDTALGAQPLDGVLRTQITAARELLIRGDTSIRSVVGKLSQPLPASLPQRLEEVVESVADEFTLPIRLKFSDDVHQLATRTPRRVADTIVKVARESLVNAAKHAGPCRVTVTLDVPAHDRMRLRVCDSGTGGPVGEGTDSHGIASLRRAVRRQGGSLRITRGRESGLTVTANLPL